MVRDGRLNSEIHDPWGEGTSGVLIACLGFMAYQPLMPNPFLYK